MELTLHPVGGYVFVAAVTAFLLVLLAAIRPARSKTTRRHRTILALLRAAAVLLVVVAMLRPTVVYTETRKQAATLVLLLDQSRSMQVADAFGSKSRWQALTDIVRSAGGELVSLADDLEIRAYVFDAEAHSVDLFDQQAGLPAEAEGQQTAIGSVLDEVVRREAGKRLVGVLLLSDGAQRSLAPRDLPPQVAGRRLADLGVPLDAFVFGESQELGDSRDVAVENLLVSPTVFAKNRLAVGAVIRANGFAGDEIPIQLLFENASGEMKVVDTTQVHVADFQRQQRIEMGYVPPVPGEYKLTLRAVQRPGELVTTNNEISTFVTVLKGGISVLYLEGAVRLEQKFIHRALDGSPDIQVDSLRLDAQHPETRPADLAQRLKPGQYDVYLLGDLDSSAFEQEELESLAEATRQGAGLIMLGGFHSFGPGGYQATALKDILPVEMGLLERQNFDEAVSLDLHLPGPLVMKPTELGRRHFVMRLAGGARNQPLWRQLPPLEGANRFRGLKPRAQVLAATDDGRPLLVAQDVGAGRVMAFAGDSTWRWWMRGFEDAHRRFWRQIVLWLAHKDESTEGSVWIKLAARRFRPGSRVEFTVGAESPAGEPVEDAKFEAEVRLPGGRREAVRLIREEDHMLGTFSGADEAGDYTIVVHAQRGTEPLGRAKSRFLVFAQDLEMENPSADPTLLASIAEQTGGESFAPEKFAATLEQFKRDAARVEVKVRSKTTLWDKWPLFLLLVGVLSTEWWLRKRWGLV